MHSGCTIHHDGGISEGFFVVPGLRVLQRHEDDDDGIFLVVVICEYVCVCVCLSKRNKECREMREREGNREKE